MTFIELNQQTFDKLKAISGKRTPEQAMTDIINSLYKKQEKSVNIENLSDEIDRLLRQS